MSEGLGELPDTPAVGLPATGLRPPRPPDRRRDRPKCDRGAGRGASGPWVRGPILARSYRQAGQGQGRRGVGWDHQQIQMRGIAAGQSDRVRVPGAGPVQSDHLLATVVIRWGLVSQASAFSAIRSTMPNRSVTAAIRAANSAAGCRVRGHQLPSATPWAVGDGGNASRELGFVVSAPVSGNAVLTLQARHHAGAPCLRPPNGDRNRRALTTAPTLERFSVVALYAHCSSPDDLDAGEFSAGFCLSPTVVCGSNRPCSCGGEY
jgi:hypothetical protein